MIELIDVTKTFNGRTVLKNLSVSIKTGETFVIIGMSGTGKTVTLKNISGLIDPDSGQVVIDGMKMNNSSGGTRKKLREKMGVVFQSGALLNWLTVGENVALPLVERRVLTGEEISRQVEEKLKLLHLYEAIDRMPAEISGGMKKRVCLARVLVRNPEIILYDEPTSGLDPVMSTVINDLIRRMQREFGVTSVVVTHDMESAYFLADRIAFLHNGEIIQCDTPEGIRNSVNPTVQQFIRGEIKGPIDVE
ncbi:MAG: ABC transporter ATP-binding protein [Spirochaetae bacterium HGW-Spirochaetae-1]|jgi:phospholipid/cholesterol/gamma-HCH transport system ATP-binding protein|nr:MAG: ABC transporter ATP-binding protein [Spirochaetae bacterium HGW-Spirochaetae-1]